MTSQPAEQEATSLAEQRPTSSKLADLLNSAQGTPNRSLLEGLNVLKVTATLTSTRILSNAAVSSMAASRPGI